MANKVREWTTEELLQYRLVNTSSRPLKGSETIEVYCRKCSKIGESKFAHLQSRMTTYGLTWICRPCSLAENSTRGKTQIGDKNPFFGKQHTDSTRQQMKSSSRVRWDNTSQEERDTVGRQIRKISYEKYGGNPMCSPEVRETYLKTVRAFFEDTNKVMARSIKIRETCLKKYGVESFLQSEDYLLNGKTYASKAENEIRDYFISLGFEVVKRRVDSIEIDIFIPELSLGIEYNGVYWHSEIYKEQNYHLKKTEYCESQNIKLIQIFDYEWETRKEQILSFLLAKTGRCSKVFARKCEVVKLSHREAVDFVKQYHIQGSCGGSSLCLGLKHEGRLLSVAVFGAHHRQSSKTVLKRFVSLPEVLIVGGLSRLASHAQKTLDTDILTWADRRWSSGEAYEASGWVAEEVLPPSYSYIKNGRYYCSKQARRKSVVNTPDDMTEREHAKIDKLFRVYDCGKIRFSYKG